MFTDRTLFSRMNKSSSRLLVNEPISNDKTIEQKEIDFHMNMEEDNDRLNFSRSFSQADPNDFGFFTLSHQEEKEEIKEEINDNPKKSEFFNTINKFVKNTSKFSLKKINLIDHVNDSICNPITGERSKVVSNKKMLIAHFAREENDYRHLRLPHCSTIERIYEEDIRNTNNSFIMKMQAKDLKKKDLELAVKRNTEYAEKKDYYEIDLILNLVNRLDQSNKPGSKVKIEEPKMFEELKKNTILLRDNYEKQKGSDRSKIKEWSLKSRDHLTLFVKGITALVDDTPTLNGAAGADGVSKMKNYVFWKKKLSELVNIWELYDSNGLDLKFPVKYLVLKKYFIDRSIKRQNNLESRKGGEDKIDIIQIIINLLCGITETKGVPKSIFMPTELITILMQFLIFLLLLYNITTMPIIEFLGFESRTLLFIEKIVEMMFFIEILCNFRKVYKDKSNNYVYDINKIFHYYITGFFIIDFLSVIPWHFFFVGGSIATYKMIRKIFSFFKLARISKLQPVLSKLEALSFGNYVKLFKLVLIFFLFAHWMGCMLFSGVDFSLEYNSLIDSCYEINDFKVKENMTFECKYYFVLYQSSYIIPGQYTEKMQVYTSLNPTSEYLYIIFFYMIGQALSAYIFGGMAAIIQNLNQGQNFFQNKIDMLNEHMLFYDVDQEIMIDVKIYFDYMWQRHKDVIYGKTHFDQLSRSLREKFERLNLPGFELLLATFVNLNPGNSKLIGNILMNLEKVILFPYELLFYEGSVTKGIFILLNGDVILNSSNGANIAAINQLINYADVISEDYKRKLKKDLKKTEINEKFSFIFPLISAFIKTGRNYQNCYSENFTDLLFLPIKAFDQLISNFPIEMHLLKHKLIDQVSEQKMFDNPNLFKIISRHSSRSISKNYEKEYDKFSIWIPIPIPISQRKIAKNYISSFIKKVRNQWREIMLMGDLNPCLNSYSILKILRSKKESDLEQIGAGNLNDPLDNIKSISKYVEKISEKYLYDNF